MNRSTWIVLLGLGLVTTPALAQQPLEPSPTNPQSYAQTAPPQGVQPAPEQPMDPYAQYGDADDEDDGLDVTYDISTSNDQAEDQQYDDGYDPNAYQEFESQLSPYGAWEDVPSYGRVWVPSSAVVGDDFTPYASGGHWLDSEYGWTWASDWDWGWAPFHYGRWMVMGGYGWCWLPGTTWGPAWVNWRWGGGYVGWAPMGPRGVAIGPPRGVRSPWRFTVAGQLGAVRPHYLPSRAVASVWGGTTAIHNVSTVNVRGRQVRFNAGPSSRMVAAVTGRTITPVALHAVAPRALPNQAIAPRVGTPVAQRPWMQHPRSVALGQSYARSAPGSHTIGSTPIYSRPGSTMIQARPQPLQYRAPAAQPFRYAPSTAYRGSAVQGRYNAPAQAYRPAPQPYRFNAPAQQTYRAAPQYRYNAPVYRSAPSQSFRSAPSQSFRSAPSQSFRSAPSQSFRSMPSQSFQSAPSQSFQSAPSQSFHSAPSQSFHSAPSQSFHSAGGSAFHGGGGGFHGGGGRR